MKGPNRCEDYCQVAHRCAAAMRGADPGITLVASGTWFPGWVKDVPPRSYRDYEYVSYHWYVQPGVKDFLGKGLTKDLLRIAHMPDTDRDRVRLTREAIDGRRPKGRPVGIAYDEWNMWYAWNRRPLAVDAVYAAGFLHMLCRSAEPLGITMAAFFEPVNEGAILVGPADSELSTMGEVFALLKVHQGGRLMDVPYSPDGDVDALATLSPNGRTVHLTLVNRRPDRPAKVALDLGCRLHAVAGQLVQLAPADAMSPAVRLVRHARAVGIPKDGRAVVDLPAFAIGRMDIPV
jgi:alpha-N-arabinofuranosidase